MKECCENRFHNLEFDHDSPYELRHRKDTRCRCGNVVECSKCIDEDSRAVLCCGDCALVTIQGIVCHETGCRSSWIDPNTGLGYAVPCLECGGSFVPEGRPSRHSLCPSCLNPEP